MQRQNITPPGGAHAAPSAYLQCLNPRCRAWHPASKPHGARPGDIFVVSRAAGFHCPGVRAGDFLIHLATDDTKPSDLVSLRWQGNTYTGFLDVEPDGRYLLMDSEGEPADGPFEPSAVSTIGRVVEVQRAARRIPLAVALRPAHAEWESVAQIIPRTLGGLRLAEGVRR